MSDEKVMAIWAKSCGETDGAEAEKRADEFRRWGYCTADKAALEYAMIGYRQCGVPVEQEVCVRTADGAVRTFDVAFEMIPEFYLLSTLVDNEYENE